MIAKVRRSLRARIDMALHVAIFVAVGNIFAVIVPLPGCRHLSCCDRLPRSRAIRPLPRQLARA